jgi:hypothetical protein
MGKTAVFVLATLHQLEPVDGEISVLARRRRHARRRIPVLTPSRP